MIEVLVEWWNSRMILVEAIILIRRTCGECHMQRHTSVEITSLKELTTKSDGNTVIPE